MFSPEKVGVAETSSLRELEQIEKSRDEKLFANIHRGKRSARFAYYNKWL
jgi:hypothetical protein